MHTRLSASAWVTVAAMVLYASAASAGQRDPRDVMMAELAPQSVQAAETIRTAYQQYLDALLLHEYTQLAGALDNGGLVPLPDPPAQFNLVVRLDGPHPIGEKDLKNQTSYVAARAATVGALLEIASRVKSGPLEITSLVRHGDYQEMLRTSNRNAVTSVPVHAMGLAVDIAIVNTPMPTVYEIRDVLQHMQAAGDIWFIGERHQLVFHVVPRPSRIGHFNEVYARAVGTPPTSRFAEVIAFSHQRPRRTARVMPKVTTEILAVLPMNGPLENLWTGAEPMAPEAVAKPAATVSQASVGLLPPFEGYIRAAAVQFWLVLLAASTAAWFVITGRPPRLSTLFEHR